MPRCRAGEKAAYYIYQICNIAIFFYLLFLKIRSGYSWQFYTGLICYILGLCLCTAAMVNFSFPDEMGFNRRGLYRFSRNPMYVAYFICFAGMAFLTRSGILLGLCDLVPDFWPLDHPCRGKMVYPEIRRSLQRIYEKSKTIYLMKGSFRMGESEAVRSNLQVGLLRSM